MRASVDAPLAELALVHPGAGCCGIWRKYRKAVRRRALPALNGLVSQSCVFNVAAMRWTNRVGFTRRQP
jgi:hypothetical protein